VGKFFTGPGSRGAKIWQVRKGEQEGNLKSSKTGEEVASGQMSQEEANARAENNPMLEVVEQPQEPTSQQLVDSGTTEAANRLKIDPCAQFFGGGSNGLKALNSLRFTADSTMDSNGHPQAQLQCKHQRQSCSTGRRWWCYA